MSTFGILIKTHLPDLPYAERLLASIDRHNVEDIPVFVVVSDADHASFAHVERAGVTLLRESVFASHLTQTDVAGFSAGYINQEIVKLCFWEAGLVDNYLCLDSDAEIIRDFRVSDFMIDDDVPYTFASADAQLRAEPTYYAEHWSARVPRLARIRDELGLEDTDARTIHGMAVFSGVVLRAFRDRFLALRGWDYVDALALVPLEPSWYTMWLQHDRTIPIVYREPVFKTFHDQGQHLDYVVRGLGAADIARGYVGVVVNSNYSRGAGLIGVDDDPVDLLAAYESEGRLARAAGVGLKARVASWLPRRGSGR